MRDNEIVILFLGRINEIKGLKYLIEAVFLLNNPFIHLFLVGPDDNYLKSLIQIVKKYKIQKQVTIINGLYNSDKIEVYRGANIFCLPSIYDCAPNSLLEAAAM